MKVDACVLTWTTDRTSDLSTVQGRQTDPPQLLPNLVQAAWLGRLGSALLGWDLSALSSKNLDQFMIQKCSQETSSPSLAGTD